MKPRERLCAYGVAELSNAELLAILLGTGTSQQAVSELASVLLEEFDGIHGLALLTVKELSHKKGIGTGKACRILAAFELGKRLQVPVDHFQRPLLSSFDVRRAYGSRLVHESIEKFIAIALDVKCKPISEFEIARGGVAHCPVQVADAFRPLLRHGAFQALFIHNHPSGDPTPSEADIELTQRLERCGILLGIGVADHVIIGRTGHYSFRDHGLLGDAQNTG